MALKNFILRQVGQLIFEGFGKRKGVAERLAELEASQRRIVERLTIADDNEANRSQLRHIIGIERWGQRRLQVLAGERPVVDEYDAYCPEPATSWEDLKHKFVTTRQETIRLARDLAQDSAPVQDKALHNDFGPLSLGGWLQYLNSHANIESKRIKAVS